MFDLQEYDNEPIKGGAEDLADGEYIFKFTGKTDTNFAEAKKMHVFKHELEIVSEGMHSGQLVTWPWFLKDTESRDRILRDLKSLGFDTGKWTVDNDRPFSKEFPKALACLDGVEFRGKKVTSGTSHFINILKRHSGADGDGLPLTFGPAELNAAAEKVADPF